MTNGILCTVDFSESSREAVKWSVSLAKKLKTHLTILYTYRLFNSGSGEPKELRKKIEAEAKRNFSKLEDELLKGQGISYDFKTEIGFVVNRVKDHAKNKGVGFLVMGNKMNTATKESFDELAENIQIPLVIIP